MLEFLALFKVSCIRINFLIASAANDCWCDKAIEDICLLLFLLATFLSSFPSGRVTFFRAAFTLPTALLERNCRVRSDLGAIATGRATFSDRITICLFFSVRFVRYGSLGVPVVCSSQHGLSLSVNCPIDSFEVGFNKLWQVVDHLHVAANLRWDLLEHLLSQVTTGNGLLETNKLHDIALSLVVLVIFE